MDESHKQGLSRRSFLAAAIAAGVAPELISAARGGESPGSMPYRLLGSTGEKVSIVGLGGYHIGKPRDEKEGIRIIRTAIDCGVNFLDNCWSYHGGESELRMGKALKDGYRDKVLLMTKIDARERKAAVRQIDECLRRFQTDTIDLMQIHEVIRMSDADRCFGPNGAMEALTEAQKAGKIRYIGFTGHKSPAVHLHMLAVAAANKFAFDAVQLPLNVLDAQFDSFEKLVVPALVKHQIGVLGMKPLAAGLIPGTRTASAVECLHYAMSLPASVVITGCDSMDTLEQALHAARTFRPLSAKARQALLARTAWLAKDGHVELYKTSDKFDGTTHHPEWMG